MTATIILDGSAHSPGRMTAKIIERILRLDDRIEELGTCEIRVKLSAGKKVGVSIVQHEPWETLDT